MNPTHAVAVIPARAGSKRVPNKNIKPFAGKPIIVYSIEALQASKLFDRIIVSTDSEAIAAVAREYGAETPFIRPKELADDITPTAPVLLHALKFLIANDEPADYLCSLYPAAPLVRAEYIRQGYELILKKKVGSVVAITSFGFPIFRSLKITETGRLQMFWPEHEMTRSQDLPHAYHDAGQFYWLDVKTFLQQPRLYAADALPVILPRHLVQDIDTPEDWTRAELMYNALKLAEFANSH